jgi:hypothetical protein
MSEETEEIKTPIKVVKKRGPKAKKAVRPKVREIVDTFEDVPAQAAPTPPKNEWPTRKAMKIKIHNCNEEGNEVPFKLGDSPLLLIRRGVEVIVPYDIKSILDDAVVDMPRCHMIPGQNPIHYTEKVTRFEYSFFGEVPWEDYIKFRNAEKAKV